MSFPQFGDKSIAYHVKVPASYWGLNIDVYEDIIFSIKGRADAAMSFEGVTNPFPWIRRSTTRGWWLAA